jgi:hypothetical protein
MLECKGCYQNFPEEKMVQDSTKKCGVGCLCKPCRSIYVSNKAILKEAKQNPDSYMDCNDCNRTFYKHMAKSKKILSICKFCGSQYIEPFY